MEEEGRGDLELLETVVRVEGRVVDGHPGKSREERDGRVRAGYGRGTYVIIWRGGYIEREGLVQQGICPTGR